MNRAIKPHAMGSYILIMYPKLEITKYAISQGLMSESDFTKLGGHPYNIYLSILRQKNIREVCNLHKFSILLVKYPFLEWIIRRLIYLPPNGMFNLIYSVSETLEFRKWSSRSSLINILFEAILNYKSLAIGDMNSKSILSKLSGALNRIVSRGVSKREENGFISKKS